MLTPLTPTLAPLRPNIQGLFETTPTVTPTPSPTPTPTPRDIEGLFGVTTTTTPTPSPSPITCPDGYVDNDNGICTPIPGRIGGSSCPPGFVLDIREGPIVEGPICNPKLGPITELDHPCKLTPGSEACAGFLKFDFCSMISDIDYWASCVQSPDKYRCAVLPAYCRIDLEVSPSPSPSPKAKHYTLLTWLNRLLALILHLEIL
jgi:hypothetical protein